MQVADIRGRMKEVGTWVDWSKTVDQVLHGAEDAEVTRAAVCWSCTLDQLRQAERAGCDLYVTHEPLYGYLQEHDLPHPAEEEKSSFLRNTALTIIRCHDLWDVMPEIGIVDSWSTFLGFEGEPTASARFYNAHDLEPGTTLGTLSRRILDRVKDVGQEVVMMFGNPDTPVSRIAVGTGAITKFRVMASLGADVLLLTDDGTRLWESAAWFRDTGVSGLLVNHATAEEPGVRNLATWIRDEFGIETHFIPQGCLYRAVT